MVDVLNGQVKLIFVVLPFSAVLGSPVGQYAQQGKPFLLEEGDYPVIEQIGRCDGILTVIELYERYLAIGVDEGLRIDTADSFDGTDIVGVLCAQITRVVGLYLAMGCFSSFARSKACNWASVKTKPSCADLASKAFNRFLQIKACNHFI
ncbi:hypothetical protein BFP75_07095 [Maribacter sp. 4G9]|nr:hypothetical protein BFP75_07095 [Maribacter sp. 4G9]